MSIDDPYFAFFVMDAPPPETAEDMEALAREAGDAGHMRVFDAHGFVFLDAMLALWGLSRADHQRAVQISYGRFRHIPASGLAAWRRDLAGWQARFLADPGQVAGLMQAQEADTLAGWGRGHSVKQPEWLIAKGEEARAAMQHIHRTQPFDDAMVLALWQMAPGEGGRDHDRIAIETVTGMRGSNLPEALFCALDYIKAAQIWSRQAEALGRGMMELEV